MTIKAHDAPHFSPTRYSVRFCLARGCLFQTIDLQTLLWSEYLHSAAYLVFSESARKAARAL